MKLLTKFLRRFSYKQGYKDAMTDAKALLAKSDLYVQGMRKGFSSGWKAREKGLTRMSTRIVGLDPGVTIEDYERALEARDDMAE